MKIYADNAAATKMSKTAVNAMLPYFDEVYGNPSSLHTSGQKAAEALYNARERISIILNCKPREINKKNNIPYDAAMFPDCENCGHCITCE